MEALSFSFLFLIFGGGLEMNRVERESRTERTRKYLGGKKESSTEKEETRCFCSHPSHQMQQKPTLQAQTKKQPHCPPLNLTITKPHVPHSTKRHDTTHTTRFPQRQKQVNQTKSNITHPVPIPLQIPLPLLHHHRRSIHRLARRVDSSPRGVESDVHIFLLGYGGWG